MKNLIAVLFLVCFVASISSCNKDNDENKNFYDQEYRDGLWINHELTDTLVFTSFSTLVRKGVYYNETYSYWIENETLFVSLGGWETSHPIQEAKNDKVVIGNMYLSTEFYDNSGTYFKDNGN
ncbi:MAG: hypothetical protein ACK5M7_19055 [Draconibacterium sp.]